MYSVTGPTGPARPVAIGLRNLTGPTGPTGPVGIAEISKAENPIGMTGPYVVVVDAPADHREAANEQTVISRGTPRRHIVFLRLASRYVVPAIGKPEGLRLVFDIETDGLLEAATRIHCIVIADLDRSRVDKFGLDQIDAGLARLSKATVLVGHNIVGFDLPVLRQLHGWNPASDCVVVDTLITSRLVLANIGDLDDQAAAMGDPKLGKLRGRHSLNAWGARLGMPKVGDDIEIWTEFTPEMQERCAGDALLTKALFQFLQPGGQPAAALALEHRVASICERITADGIPFDREAAEQLQEQWTARRNTLELRLRQQFPQLKNLNSRQQTAALLEERGWVPEKRTEKTRQPKIDDETLEDIIQEYPEFDGLAEHYILGRRLGQLAIGTKAWLRHIGPDGRIHGGILHIGTPHHRAKHLDPNLAQVPNPKKGKPFATECRSLFRTKNDWVFVACDQAGLQDRGFAHYLAEFDGGAYARTFGDGTDTHWQSAIALGLIPAGIERDKNDAVHTAIREGAKRFRYAFLYGAGDARAGAIIADIRRDVQRINPNSSLRPLSGSEARQRFMAGVPGLAELRQVLDAQHTKHEWVVGLDGRRVPSGAQYKALNRRVTSSEAIICKRWLVSVYDELHARFRYGWDGDVVLVAWVHDEIVACCRPQIADEVGAVMVRWAKEAGEHYEFEVPLDADYKVGRSWAGEIPTNKATEIASPTAHIEEKYPHEDAIDRPPPCEPPRYAEHDGEDVDQQPMWASAIPAEEPTPRPKSNGSGEEYKICCPFHDERTPSLHIYADGHYHCFGCGAHGQAQDLPGAPVHNRTDDAQQHKAAGQAAFYVYNDARGRPYLGVKRTPNKVFPQYYWDGSGWISGAPAGPKIPYRLPQLLDAPSDALVIIAAGEKDANTAARLGFVATTNSGGEGNGRWTPELNMWFVGRQRVAIMEDNDATGRAHAIEVANALRGIVPDIRIVTFRELPAHGDLTDWIEAEPSRGKAALEAHIAAANSYRRELPIAPIREWDDKPKPEIGYGVDDRFPRKVVCIFSGEGGSGKSTATQQLAVAHTLEREWLDCTPHKGPAIYVECEDPIDVLHWRQKAIAEHYGVTQAAIADAGFVMLPLADGEESAILATAPDKSGIIHPTPLYERLYEMAGDLKPIMIGIASAAIVFAGNENVRPEVQQFMWLLRRLAHVSGGYVLLVAQPSLTGIGDASVSHAGLAGTTQWHNGSRGRAVLRTVKPEGSDTDTGLREIKFYKNQYGPLSSSCFVRYTNGLFLPVENMSLGAAERAAKAEEVFILLLKKFTEQRQTVNHLEGRNYAPKRFAEQTEAAGIDKRELKAAMQRLLDGGVVEIRDLPGKASRPSFYLAMKGS
jgi:RecA-family ATPase/DNA polymerase I-like protein with 3'-5' exonuclease and polymerase domains